MPETGTLSAPGDVPVGEGRDRARRRAPARPRGGIGSSSGSGCGADERAAVQRRRSAPCSAASGRRSPADSAMNARDVVVERGWVEAPLEADRRRRLRAHRLPAERARDVAGIDLDAVAELDEAAERVEEPLGALARLDREIRPGGVADEERVAGQHEPRIGPARAVDDGEAAVLGPVAGRVDAAQHDVADRDLVAVLHRVVRVLRPRRRDGCSPGRRARARGVRGPRGGRRACASRSRGRCARRAARPPRGTARSRTPGRRRPRFPALVADEVGGAAEIVVDELREDHGAADASSGCRYPS